MNCQYFLDKLLSHEVLKTEEKGLCRKLRINKSYLMCLRSVVVVVVEVEVVVAVIIVVLGVDEDIVVVSKMIIHV